VRGRGRPARRRSPRRGSRRCARRPSAAPDLEQRPDRLRHVREEAVGAELEHAAVRRGARIPPGTGRTRSASSHGAGEAAPSRADEPRSAAPTCPRRGVRPVQGVPRGERIAVWRAVDVVAVGLRARVVLRVDEASTLRTRHGARPREQSAEHVASSASPSRASISQSATCPRACTPASVRPAARSATLRRVSPRQTSSITPARARRPALPAEKSCRHRPVEPNATRRCRHERIRVAPPQFELGGSQRQVRFARQCHRQAGGHGTRSGPRWSCNTSTRRRSGGSAPRGHAHRAETTPATPSSARPDQAASGRGDAVGFPRRSPRAAGSVRRSAGERGPAEVRGTVRFPPTTAPRCARPQHAILPEGISGARRRARRRASADGTPPHAGSATSGPKRQRAAERPTSAAKSAVRSLCPTNTCPLAVTRAGGARAGAPCESPRANQRAHVRIVDHLQQVRRARLVRSGQVACRESTWRRGARGSPCPRAPRSGAQRRASSAKPGATTRQVARASGDRRTRAAHGRPGRRFQRMESPGSAVPGHAGRRRARMREASRSRSCFPIKG